MYDQRADENSAFITIRANYLYPALRYVGLRFHLE